jgi:hypothetical protein
MIIIETAAAHAGITIKAKLDGSAIHLHAPLVGWMNVLAHLISGQ